MKNWLGCTKLTAWNSVVRKNDPSVKVKDIPKQQGPEKGLVPTARMQPIAGIAHVDQDSVSWIRLIGTASFAILIWPERIELGQGAGRQSCRKADGRVQAGDDRQSVETFARYVNACN